MGRGADAETELQTALRLDPEFIPGMVNLADLYRSQQRDDEAQQLLEKAIAVAPNSADPIHALGLLKVRQKHYQDAIRLWRKPPRFSQAMSATSPIKIAGRVLCLRGGLAFRRCRPIGRSRSCRKLMGHAPQTVTS